jgi:hypothetical protein
MHKDHKNTSDYGAEEKSEGPRYFTVTSYEYPHLFRKMYAEGVILRL